MISVIINADTRPQNLHANDMFNGVRTQELLVQCVINKRQAFAGHDAEFILYVDEHEPLSPEVWSELHALTDSMTTRRHTKRYREHNDFGKFNDINYLAALSQARGDIVVHFDQDLALFVKDKSAIDNWLAYLDQYKFVSYPSEWSPVPTIDASFEGKWWVSTRAFACKRETLKFDEIERCLMDTDYIWKTYGDFPRKCPWFEHILSYINQSSVLYPPWPNDLLMFCWNTYHPGTATYLNRLPFARVRDYVIDCGGIHYPNDLHTKPL